ncbi:MAG: hypothetical protein IH861_09555 [Chloroflexi bacterium]|nr:hypothetical protein [Chloroflexota bacterium]
MKKLLILGISAILSLVLLAAQTAKPETEPAWYGGVELVVNFIEVADDTPHRAHSVLYVVGPDQDGDGDAHKQTHPGILETPHDHVLDSVPGDSNYRPIRHIFVAVDNVGNLAGPGLMSEADVLAAEEAGTVNLVDTGLHFLIAVVDEHSG